MVVWIKRILNVLFVIVVIAGIVLGWNMEDGDSESIFPGLFGSSATQSAPATDSAQPTKVP